MSHVYVILGVVGGYVGSSVLLLLFPTLLHKKKTPTFSGKHISHRGGAGERLENTLDAFRNSAQTGTEMFEIDVQLTKDEQVVISHDDDLYRVSGRSVKISECNYDDLPLLSSTLQVPFSKKGTFISRPDDERKVALLRDVLEEFPHMALNIDTKRNDDVIDPTIQLIREFKRENNVVMANFRSEPINYVHKVAPDLMLGTSAKRVAFIVLTFYLGLLPFLPLKESYFEVFLPSIFKDLGVAKNWQVSLIQTLLIRKLLLKHLQKRGIQVYLFVLNDVIDFDYCLNELGVDGVMTDYPTKLRQFLDENCNNNKSG